MKIDSTNVPRYADKDVRFRTIYYFRVYDFCTHTADSKGVQADALYRFRMTGKADSLTNAVHFESGTLSKEQIDPFGSTVEYDSDAHRYYYLSSDESARQRASKQALDDARHLVAFYKELAPAPKRAGPDPTSDVPNPTPVSKPNSGGDDSQNSSVDKPVQDFRNAVMDVAIARVNELRPEAPKDSHTSQTQTVTNLTSPTATSAGMSSGTCDSLRRGFQILGPEGWRIFDQDERLMLAMSSSGEPLISTLKELSGRVLANQSMPAQSASLFLQEEVRIARAQQELARPNTDLVSSTVDAINAAVAQLDPKTPASEKP